MNTLELFCGTKSFSKVAKELGHKTYTVDSDPQHNPDDVRDIFSIPDIYSFDVIWASPPCESFSVASIGKHWQGTYEPKSEQAKISLKLLEHTIMLIANSGCEYWFIENPRCVTRKIIDPMFKKYHMKPIRHTITYCQYGDTRMKPTDIWTNCFEWQPKPVCKNGDPCHEKAPRGSRTGTQGIKGARDRGVIPPALFYEIFNSIDSKEEVGK